MLNHKLSSNNMNNYTNSKYHLQTLQSWFKVKNKPAEAIQNIFNEYIFLNSQLTINNSYIHPKHLGLDIELNSM